MEKIRNKYQKVKCKCRYTSTNEYFIDNITILIINKTVLNLIENFFIILEKLEKIISFNNNYKISQKVSSITRTIGFEYE